MRQLLISILLVILLIIPVSAIDITAPDAPETVQDYMPAKTDSFGEGLLYVLKSAIQLLQPNITEASGICLSLIAITLLSSMIGTLSGNAKHVTNLVSTLSISVLLIRSTNSLLNLGIGTINELSEYGKLLLAAMTTALAAQGGTVTSAALYTGTTLFNTALTTSISKLLTPLLYIYLCLCIGNCALSEGVLKRMCDLVKWLISWTLKIILYVFTGYIGITGVVSGTADASAIKAAKLAISGAIPVVGNILSDASEAILVSAGVLKSSAGVYGLLVLIAIGIGPFLEVGLQYLLLKLTASVCNVFGAECTCGLLHDFSTCMGLILAMVGTVCLLLLISTVCFMKGVG